MNGKNLSPLPGTGLHAVAMALVILSLLAGCGAKQSQPATPAGGAPTAGTEAAPTTPPAVPAPAVTQATWAPDALEKLVAPIALYPDQLVGQILAASVNPQEVLDAGNWLLQNETLKGDALDAAAQQAGLGPAMRALLQFPSVVDMMCQQMDWTRQLGSAFTSDQRGVLDAVQRLRGQAAQVGNLKSTPQQTVETKTENQKTIIEVKPANPQIIYVPQYNPQIIYTTPPPPPPPASSTGTVSTDAAVVGGLLAFGVGIAVGAAINNNDCYPHWGAGAVYVGHRPFYPPAYVYHPAYGPAFRPSYGYRNTNVNGNVNININNSNYFNQFNNNQNFRKATPYNTGGNNGNPPANNNWKGQSSYAGARNTAQTQRLNEAAGRATPTQGGQYLGGSGSTRNPALAKGSPGASNTGATRNPTLANRSPGASNTGGSRGATQNVAPAGRNPPADRGYGDSNRSNPSGLGAARNDGGARTAARPAGTAFAGAGDSSGGAFARAASARGNASAGGGGRGRLGR
jgi:Protein of unknown function (DUF3300)